MKNMLLICTLGFVALAGGLGVVIAAQHYGWIPDKTSDYAVTPESCPHQIDSARCPFCNPDLVDSLGWCNEHSVAEALCTRCTPGLVLAFKATNDWCAEHAVPESQCTLCGTGGARPAAALASLQSDAPTKEIMRANRPPSTRCTNAFATVQLKSPDIARRAGLQVVPVRTETIDETITCNAEVAFDGNRHARLASRVPGNIAEVTVDLGDHVEAGDVLAVIDSSEVGSAKAAYLQARSLVDLWEKNEARERVLFEKKVGTELDVLEAETKLVESRVQMSNAGQRLKNLGVSEDAMARVVESADTSSQLQLRAPFAGVVIERDAVIGEVVSTSQPLFAIADLTTMWIMLDVYESDVARLHAGQHVTLSIDAMQEPISGGTLTWISSHVDPRTRTIQARAEIENSDGMLRANMFGRAEVHVQTLVDAVLVPESAVQWDGCCNVVFVRHTDTIYQPYKVTLGYKRNGYYVVTDGLPSGESVVTEGSFLLKTEILKGSIGAGCCEVDPGAGG